MEFLYKLYDMEYFPVALLIVIAILVFLFLLILFFGKKEEKERKLEETKKLELEKNGFKEVETGKEELKVPEIPQPVLEQVENVEQNVQTDAVIPTFESSIEEEINVEQSNDEVITPSFEIPVILPLESFANTIMLALVFITSSNRYSPLVSITYASAVLMYL